LGVAGCPGYYPSGGLGLLVVILPRSLPHIEHYRREANAEWCYRVAGGGERIALQGDALVDVDTVYRGVFELEGD
jgi:hypothetical protein